MIKQFLIPNDKGIQYLFHIFLIEVPKTLKYNCIKSLNFPKELPYYSIENVYK